LIHEALQPNSRKDILQLKINLDSHLFAWHVAVLPSLSLPPRIGCVKGNFDVAIKDNFAVAAAVLVILQGILLLQLHRNFTSLMCS
jgi:hypothetical protein